VLKDESEEGGGGEEEEESIFQVSRPLSFHSQTFL
jgi:hypothetical protein